MTDKTEVIVIRESLLASIGRDVVTLAMFVVMIGLGVYLQSSAMQWMGAILFFIWIYQIGSGNLKKNRMTIAQARKKLDELERTK